MHIPHELYRSFGATTCICVLLSLFFWYQIYNELQDKDKLDSVTGKIITWEKKEVRANGGGVDTIDHFLIDKYPRPFELYQESEKVAGDIDKLKVGDIIKVYYQIDKLSRMLNQSEEIPAPSVKYIEKDGVLQFERPPFMMQISICIIAILYSVVIGSYIMYRKGKMQM